MIEGLEYLTCEEGQGAGTIQPKEKVQKNLINVCKYLQRGYKEDAARLFLVVPGDRGKEQKLNHRRFPMNIRKLFFTVRAGGLDSPERFWSFHPWK